MKYTRYNYKPKKNNKMTLSIIIIMVLSIIVGSFIFNLLFKSTTGEKNNNITANSSGKLYVLQCGVFEKKENAQKYYQEIGDKYTKFIVEEEGKNKIFIGFFDEEKINDVKQQLNKESVNNMTSEIDVEDATVTNVIDAYMQVAQKVKSENVESINTNGLKKWINDNIDLEKLSQKEKQIINYINNLPEEYTKKEVEKDLTQIYSLLRKNYN